MVKYTGHTITTDSVTGSAEIERSVKFNTDDGQVLSRTPSSAGNRKKWTFSAWIKRSNLGAEARIFGGKANASHIYFASNDELTWDLANVDSGSVSANLNTHQVFRDVSGWYHLVCALDTDESTADNRMRMYINGTEITGFGSRTNPSSGYATNAINDTTLHTIGRRTSDQGSDGMRFDGYMAEINFIDGQQLDASYFGFTDGQTNIWMPKRYQGTYGTNGFRLDFNDNSSTAALGIDKSPNGNDFTTNNFSVSAGVGNDSVIDSPTNNFCTFSPLKTNPSNRITYKEGNLQYNCVSGNNHLRSTSTMSVSSGKWYVEAKFISGYESPDGTTSFAFQTDNAGHRDSNNDAVWYENSNDYKCLRYSNNGDVHFYNASSGTTLFSTLQAFANGDVMGVALDLDNDKFFVSKNGTFFSNGTGNQDPVTGANPLISGSNVSDYKNRGWNFSVSGYSDQVVTVDFGQQGFAYTPPKGFKAISSKNFVPSTPAFRNPRKHFHILTYTGNSTNNRAITGLGFSPDLVWIKRRSGGNQSPFWVSRGITISDSGGTGNVGPLAPNQTYAQTNTSTDGGFASFDIDGFTLGKGSSTANADAPYQRNNADSATYVAWCWKAGGATTVANTDGSVASAVSVNKEGGFSIVTYTGPNGNGTIGHGLGKAPKWIVIKRLETASTWVVYHESIGNTKRLGLDLAGGSSTSSNWWNNTSPTSTTFSVGTDAGHGGSTDDYVAYCWTDVPGFSKFGSYVGNGNSDGDFVNLGFRPAFILIKREASENWIIADYKRNSNDRTSPADSYIVANGNGAESTGIIYDLVQNGVKFQSSSQNESGSVYYYAAFADSPGITPFGGATANAQ